MQLGPNELEIGLGIHGEQGTKRIVIKDEHVAHTCVTMMLNEYILQDPVFAHVTAGAQVALLVNNLGGTSNLEMSVVAKEAILNLEKKGIVVKRVYVGAFMTALEMHGFSLSLLLLPKDDTSILSYLDAPCESTAWHASIYSSDKPRSSKQNQVSTLVLNSESDQQVENEASQQYAAQVVQQVLKICNKAIEAEPELTQLDTICGDADLGKTLEQAAKRIIDWLKSYKPTLVSQLLYKLAFEIQKMGGSSGPFYSIFVLRMSQVWKQAESAKGVLNIDATWQQALKAGIDGVQQMGGAKQGDRTMIDALIPFYDAVVQGKPDAALYADNGAEQTKLMQAKKGRAAYLNMESIKGTRDPGAHAVALWTKALFHKLEMSQTKQYATLPYQHLYPELLKFNKVNTIV